MEAPIFLLLVLLVGAVVTAPLRRARTAEAGGSATAALEAARDAKLREIHDTELDHSTGKLSDADYAVLDATLRAEAAELLRDLERARDEEAAA
jgi:hypothetical protein